MIRPSATSTPASRLSLAAVFLVLVALVWPVSAAAQSDEGFELSPSVLESLARLQDQWLLWNSAFLQSDRERAEATVAEMVGSAGELGQDQLPELALASLVRGVEAARQGDLERAEWALEAAERLDPGLPEQDFARAKIARASGSYLNAVGLELRGLFKAFVSGPGRSTLYLNLVFWLGLALVVTSGVFVGLEMATKGPFLVRDLRGAIGSLLPSWMSFLFAIVFLTWPFVLPNGWIWGALFWGVLLWGYGSHSERRVLVVCFVVLTLLPTGLVWLQWGIGRNYDDLERVLDRIRARELYGQMFQDLSQLQMTFPEDPAVRHLVGDVHVGIGQDDYARPNYSFVADQEADNGAALNNLGVYHFFRKEYIAAIDFLKQAYDASVDDAEVGAAASFNLSQTYSDLLEFGNHGTYLMQARSLAPRRATEWIDRGESAVTLEGGYKRVPEIRNELRQRFNGPQVVDLVQPVGACLLAIALAPLIRWLRAGTSGGWSTTTSGDETALERWGRRLIPGVLSTEAGDGLRAFLAVLVPTSLLLLPISGVLANRPSWALEPGSAWSLFVGVGGFLVFYVVRWWRS